MTLLLSWVESANTSECEFPLNNLPYGVFSVNGDEPRCGVAIGEYILNLQALESSGLIALSQSPLFDSPSWNTVMLAGNKLWQELRNTLTAILAEGSEHRVMVEPHLVSMASATMHMPFTVAEYTDFYAGRHHATNVGTMFRGAENALPPNWLSMPIGYNGRASSVVITGTPVRRPWGQLKGPDDELPHFAPCARFDFELEIGAVVGQPSDGMLTVEQADENIFGYVLLNDWSARDIQAWEYQPLGPFQAKATATTISPWIVTPAALEPFRVSTPKRDRPLLPHLSESGPMLYDIDLSVTLSPNGKSATTLSRTNYREMYYSAAQQLAHHTTSGCPMNTGDLLGSGTISGADKHQYGSMLELSWGGKEPVKLDTGETRSFLENGDILILGGHAQGNGFRIGFGTCSGEVFAALDDPYSR